MSIQTQRSSNRGKLKQTPAGKNRKHQRWRSDGYTGRKKKESNCKKQNMDCSCWNSGKKKKKRGTEAGKKGDQKEQSGEGTASITQAVWGEKHLGFLMVKRKEDSTVNMESPADMYERHTQHQTDVTDSQNSCHTLTKTCLLMPQHPDKSPLRWGRRILCCRHQRACWKWGTCSSTTNSCLLCQGWNCTENSLKGTKTTRTRRKIKNDST